MRSFIIIRWSTITSCITGTERGYPMRRFRLCYGDQMNAIELIPDPVLLSDICAQDGLEHPV